MSLLLFFCSLPSSEQIMQHQQSHNGRRVFLPSLLYFFNFHSAVVKNADTRYQQIISALCTFEMNYVLQDNHRTVPQVTS